MPIVKMKYGIDLGTTNSSLCKFENGEVTIVKTDTLKEIMPSCVSFTPKRVIKVGDSAYNDLCADRAKATKEWTQNETNVFIEFKRTMGLDKKYKSTNMKKSYTSEQLSAEVLKKLLSFEDEKINACVVTIPAKFKSDQIAATMRAANLAGITHCELLQEPIAATIAYGIGLSGETDGYWLVFDFGGGTFDAALVNYQEGILQVKDTEGDNYLGGKNIDYAIVDEILIPYVKENNNIDKLSSKALLILREGLKYYAEQAKNNLSFADAYEITSQLDEFGNDDDGNEIELDLTVTKEQLVPVIQPFFQKAIDICLNLIQRNNLTPNQITSVILVGGPTQSPVLKEMLEQQVSHNIDTHVNPMTAVTLGASIYASTIDYNEEIVDTSENAVALEVNYESSTVEMIEYVTIKTLYEESIGEIPSNLFVELERSDNAWSSGKVKIEEDGVVIECYLQENISNTFYILLTDESGNKFNCYPKEIAILQGKKIGNALLPYYIGIEIKDIIKDKRFFATVEGLEKNVILPAVGTINQLYVPADLRAGDPHDVMTIPIYQGEYNANGKSAVCSDHVFDVVIDGSDIKNSVNIGSDLAIKIKVDRSQMMILEAEFKETGEIIEKTITVNQRESIKIKNLNSFIKDTKDKIKRLKKMQSVDKEELLLTEKMLKDIKARFDAEKISDDGRMHLFDDIRRVYLEAERVEMNHELDFVKDELEEYYYNCRKFAVLNSDSDDKISDNLIDEIDEKYKYAKNSDNVDEIRLVIKELNKIEFEIAKYPRLRMALYHFYHDFEPDKWTDPDKAKMILKKLNDRLLENPVIDFEIGQGLAEIRRLFKNEDGNIPLLKYE